MKKTIKQKLHLLLLNALDRMALYLTGNKVSSLEHEIEQLKETIHSLEYKTIAELELDLMSAEEQLQETESDRINAVYDLYALKHALILPGTSRRDLIKKVENTYSVAEELDYLEAVDILWDEIVVQKRKYNVTLQLCLFYTWQKSINFTSPPIGELLSRLG